MILYVVPRFEECGPVNQVYTLAKHVDRNVSVLALSPGQREVREQFREADVGVDVLDSSGSRSPIRLVRAFRRDVREREPALVHSHGFRPDGIAATLRTNPTISTLHNVPRWDYPHEYGLLGYGLVPAHQAIHTGIDCSVACSGTVRRRTIWSDVTIHNGIDESAFRPVGSSRRDELRDELNLGPDETIFVTVGRMIERKNVVQLVTQFLASDTDPATRLLLLGDGPRRKRCERLAADDESVRIEGYVDEVRPYLQASDYFISASRAEGLPLSVIEAMSCGLPAVLSDIGPHREILGNAPRSGSLFALDDPIDFGNAVASGDRLDGEAARTTVERRFTGERMATKYGRIYDELLGQPEFERQHV